MFSEKLLQTDHQAQPVYCLTVTTLRTESCTHCQGLLCGTWLCRYRMRFKGICNREEAKIPNLLSNDSSLLLDFKAQPIQHVSLFVCRKALADGQVLCWSEMNDRRDSDTTVQYHAFDLSGRLVNNGVHSITIAPGIHARVLVEDEIEDFSHLDNWCKRIEFKMLQLHPSRRLFGMHAIWRQ